MRQISPIDAGHHRARWTGKCRPTATEFGFTLIELVVVMVLIGILGAVVALMGSPIRGGIEGQRRAELADAADTAYRKLARDIRRALPNSIRLVSATEIEFISTNDGGRYQDITDGLVTGTPLNFSSSAVTQFTVLGPMPSIQADDYLVINNWGRDSLNAYCAGTTCNNRALVSSISGADIQMASNPYAALGDAGRSPGNRFHVIDKDEEAISYQCTGGKLVRLWNYGFTNNPGSLAAPTGSAGLLAENISCDFSYVAYDAALWGLLRLSLTMSRSDLTDAPITLVYQLHVDNTP